MRIATKQNPPSASTHGELLTLSVLSVLYAYTGSYRDGLLKPAPGCQRAVTEAVALLEKKGYTVVPIQGPDIHKVVQSGYSYANY